MAIATEKVAEAFEKHFSHVPKLVVRAPGRVNLIGEHTDYNDGFVFPAALECEVKIAASPRDDSNVRLFSLNYEESEEFPLAVVKAGELARWSNYVKGVIMELLAAGYPLQGFDAVICGDVPLGSGLSSSAALEVAAASTIASLFSLEIPGKEIALLCQRAEHTFVGVKCGIMDQFISALGEEDHGLFIDCRTLDYRAIPLNLGSCSLIICDSKAPRELAGSAYNERLAECHEGVKLLSSYLPGIRALRDVASGEFTGLEDRLPEPVRKRCRHVITENERTAHAVEVLQAGKLREFGALMNESHRSLQKDYEVSSPWLDELVALACAGHECLGSRMTGAGFGGCTVSLVENDGIDAFIRRVSAGYEKTTGKTITPFRSRATKGAGVVPLVERR